MGLTERPPVTVGRVLRRADVTAAGALLSVPVPARVRTAADVGQLHRPWCLAVMMGLIRVGEGRASSGPALELWPLSDAESLAGWLAGLRAVCAAESYPQDEDGLRLLARSLLMALDDAASPGRALWLGRWAAQRICADLPALASPRLTAAELITAFARFADEEQQWHVAWGWLAERDPAHAARDILTAAQQMSPLQRLRAVSVAERLGDNALPAWRKLTTAPCGGPHARAVLASFDLGPELDEADRRWLAAETAAAALEDKGPDEALSCLSDAMPGDGLDNQLAVVRATGHPGAGELVRAITEFAASGAPRSINQVVQLKVSLHGMRTPIWRRALVPATATLGDLHEVIQVVYGWDGDHLHVFRVGKNRYSDPFAGLDEAKDEEETRLGELAASGAAKISYTYDLGACWQHEIMLEATLAREDGRNCLVCAEFSGDSPEEYPPADDGSDDSDDEPAQPRRFSLPDVNRKLAALGPRES